jgi:hypothetical protein
MSPVNVLPGENIFSTLPALLEPGIASVAEPLMVEAILIVP